MVARCLLDNDDEVRDRALLYLEVLKQKQKALSSAYILNSECVHMWRVMEVREEGGSEEKTYMYMNGNVQLSIHVCIIIVCQYFQAPGLVVYYWCALVRV